MNPWIDHSAVRFAIVGLANTLVGLAIIYAAKWFLGWNDILANVTGYAGGLSLSFVFNKRWTFAHFGDTAGTFCRFLVVLLVAYVVNLMSVVAAVRLGIDGYLAQALGIVPYALISYLGSKQLVFVARSAEQGR